MATEGAATVRGTLRFTFSAAHHYRCPDWTRLRIVLTTGASPPSAVTPTCSRLPWVAGRPGDGHGRGFPRSEAARRRGGPRPIRARLPERRPGLFGRRGADHLESRRGPVGPCSPRNAAGSAWTGCACGRTLPCASSMRASDPHGDHELDQGPLVLGVAPPDEPGPVRDPEPRPPRPVSIDVTGTTTASRSRCAAR